MVLLIAHHMYTRIDDVTDWIRPLLGNLWWVVETKNAGYIFYKILFSQDVQFTSTVKCFKMQHNSYIFVLSLKDRPTRPDGQILIWPFWHIKILWKFIKNYVQCKTYSFIDFGFLPQLSGKWLQGITLARIKCLRICHSMERLSAMKIWKGLDGLNKEEQS